MSPISVFPFLIFSPFPSSFFFVAFFWGTDKQFSVRCLCVWQLQTRTCQSYTEANTGPKKQMSLPALSFLVPSNSSVFVPSSWDPLYPWIARVLWYKHASFLNTETVEAERVRSDLFTTLHLECLSCVPTPLLCAARASPLSRLSREPLFIFF